MVIGLTRPREIGRIDLAPYYAGQELVLFDGQYYDRWIVASHACASLRKLYLDGVAVLDSEFQWQWPGHPGYSDRFGAQQYRDLNGRRYFVVYGLSTHPDVMAVVAGEKILRANVWGVESDGDGTGLVLTDGHDQFLHWMINFGPLGDYQSGAYLTAPTWDPIAEHCKIDAESFRAVRDAAAASLSGGIVCSGVIKEFKSQRDWMARWLVSLHARIGQNAAGQWKLTRRNANATPTATYTEIRHVQAGSVSFDPLHDEHWTRIPFRFGYDSFTNTWQEGVKTADEEETDYMEERPGPTFDLFFIQSPSVADWVMDQFRDEHRVLPWRVSFETINLCGTNNDLGDVIGLTGSWGLDLDGWTSFPVFLEWHSTLPGVQRVRLTGRTNVAPHEFSEAS
jgi:hypothetical protein